MKSSKILVWVGLATVALCLGVVPSSNAKAGVLSDGYYEGTIQTATGPVPIQVSLSFTDDEIAGEPDEILPYKKLLLGSFLLDNEAGPWSFTEVDYDLTTGEVEFSYARNVTISAGTTTTAASPSTTLLFSGQMQADGSIAGTVNSGRGIIGPFKISPAPNLHQLTPVPATVGHWKGTWTYADGTTAPFDLVLAPSTLSTANPAELELAYSPGRSGSGQIGSLQIAFTTVIIDYFKNSIEMTYTNPASAGTGGGTLNLEAPLNGGDEMDGIGISSFGGRIGTFKSTRVN